MVFDPILAFEPIFAPIRHEDCDECGEHVHALPDMSECIPPESRRLGRAITRYLPTPGAS